MLYHHYFVSLVCICFAVRNGLSFASFLDGHHHVRPECPTAFQEQKEDLLFVCFCGSVVVTNLLNGPRFQQTIR